MKTRKAEKGQVSFYDFLIAMMLFMIAFTVLNGVWVNNYANATGMFAMNDMESRTLQALNSLIKTKGYPENWNAGNVEIIGLASKKNAIDEAKLAQFRLMAYDDIKEKLKLEGYDFNFEFYAQNPADDFNIFSSSPSISSNPNIISLARAVEFKGGSAVVQFKVFR
ncbi:MAG: hypothetical protein V1493_02400 [Candidatus Diapherotrites archaeon]